MYSAVQVLPTVMPPSKTVYGTQMETQDRRKIKKNPFGKGEKACVKI